ncbi:unnamed protein product [Spirodela intermedia]|uniref:Uncharacterized protein n=1 Tax=Spirodela intermedia TaxID=51605 RepID=A0A7I8J094_SPIIN|nr:unnamed protein product [Spirodela intermedia]CAA6663635.1 unnamed protein product [Spirodela intermedia]
MMFSVLIPLFWRNQKINNMCIPW